MLSTFTRKQLRTVLNEKKVHTSFCVYQGNFYKKNRDLHKRTGLLFLNRNLAMNELNDFPDLSTNTALEEL